MFKANAGREIGGPKDRPRKTQCFMNSLGPKSETGGAYGVYDYSQQHRLGSVWEQITYGRFCGQAIRDVGGAMGKKRLCKPQRPYWVTAGWRVAPTAIGVRIGEQIECRKLANELQNSSITVWPLAARHQQRDQDRA